MSSWTNDLVVVGEFLLRCGGILLMSLGMFSSLMVVVLFVRSPLNESPCSIYLIVNGILSFCLHPFYFLPNIITFAFGYNLLALNGTFCKFQMSYGIFTVTSIIVLNCFISFDRFVISSRSVRIRCLSSKKTSTILTLIGLSFSFLFISIPVAVQFDNILISSSRQLYLCSSKSHSFLIFAALFYFPFIQAFIPIVLTIFFGYLTRRQIRTLKNENFIRRFDKQMTRMYFYQILSQMISSVPFATINLYRTLTSTTIRSIQMENLVQFIRLLSILLFYLQYSTDFYIYYLTSNEIRNQTKIIFRQIFSICFPRRENQIHPMTILTQTDKSRTSQQRTS